MSLPFIPQKENNMSKKIEKSEDFIAWQKARRLSRRVYQAPSLPGFSRDFALKDRIRRSAISIMSNIAEGFERGRPAKFHQFLSIAKASCAELRSQLYVALDANYLTASQFQELMSAALEVGQIIGGLRVAVEKRKLSG
jgi:four helix bundle protein